MTTHPQFILPILALMIALSEWLAELLAAPTGLPSILILTTLALVLAQIPWVHRLPGARLTGCWR